MKPIRFFLPRVEYILFASIFWGIASSGPRLLNFDGDLPRHILTGNMILDTHHIATTDIFSFRTEGYPSVPHEWLSQVVFAAAYRWLDLSGIVLLVALIIMLTWVIVYYQAVRISNSLISSLIFTALAVAASQIHVLPRPHIFTYFLTAFWIVLLENISDRKRSTWWLLPLIMLLWVNLHGMFVLGVMIWAIYLVGDFLDHLSLAWFKDGKTKSLALGGGLSLIATFFSPSGVKIWEAIASLGSNAYITSKIPEYQSANFHLPETWPFIILLFLLIIGFARTREKVAWTHILLVVSFTGLGLYTSRMIPMFAIVVAPIAAKAFAGWLQDESGPSRLFLIQKNIHKLNSLSNGLIWLPVVIITTIILFNSGRTIDPENRGNAFDERFFPVRATTWLKHHPQRGHMFNEFDWGGYLLLELWPTYKIFMDGHTHIYGEELTREYEKVTTLGKDWPGVLKKYDVEWAIIRTNDPLANMLQESLHWEIAYQDETATILARK